MSQVFIAWEPAPAGTVFASGAFDGQIGSMIPVKLPGGREVQGKIRSVTVAKDGDGAQYIIEVPDGTLLQHRVSESETWEFTRRERACLIDAVMVLMHQMGKIPENDKSELPGLQRLLERLMNGQSSSPPDA